MSKERGVDIPQTERPQVPQPIFDREKFLEIRDMLERLEKMGVKRKEYQIGFPYGPRVRPRQPEKEGKKGYDLVPPFGRKVRVLDGSVPQKLPRGRMR